MHPCRIEQHYLQYLQAPGAIGNLTDLIRTAEELGQDKNCSFQTNVYRQNRLLLK